MQNQKLKLAKNSTVAIGLVTKDNGIPTLIAGSGFFINQDGVALTARHVIDLCESESSRLCREDGVRFCIGHI
jgi:S1-C subfamily serine protease